jgi:hypothetical protein
VQYAAAVTRNAPLVLCTLSLLKSLEKAHTVLNTHMHVAACLGVPSLPMCMDLQVMYLVLAHGNGGSGLYLHLPMVGRGYQERIRVCVSPLMVF